MAREASRRKFVAGVGAALGAASLAPRVRGTSPIEGRFVVDYSDAAEGWLADSSLTVVREFELSDVAIVRGEESALSGRTYFQDFEVDVETPETRETRDIEEPSADAEPHPLQWDKQSQGIDEVHDAEATGEGVRIGIIDDGVYVPHPDLNVNTELSRDFTGVSDREAYVPDEDFDHGTHVAGIAAASGRFLTGVAPDAEVVSVRVLNNGGSFGDIFAGLDYAADVGCDVANMSLGAPPIDSTINIRALEQVVSLVAEGVERAGTVTVVSNGNSDSNADADGAFRRFFADEDRFVGVSAAGPNGFDWGGEGTIVPAETPAVFTDYGSDITDLSAAGGNFSFPAFDDPEIDNWFHDFVFSTIFRESDAGNLVPTYGWKAGTSMSAPQVTGAAALVVEQNPGADPAAVRRHLKDTADRIEAGEVDYEESLGASENAVNYFDVDDNPDSPIGDGNLEDPYSSELYRGSGHLNVEDAAARGIPFTEPVGPDEVIPRDLDGDGLYEDVDGDGELTRDDVYALFKILLGPGGSDFSPTQVEALDFNGDGRLDGRDVQALLRRV